MTPNAQIQTSQLSMRFGRSLALDELSLTIPRGAIYALVGPNGAGKTTLIKLLLNILRPTSGSATVLGQPSTSITGSAPHQASATSPKPGAARVDGRPPAPQLSPPLLPRTGTSPSSSSSSPSSHLPIDRKLKHLSRGQRMKAALLSVLPYRPSLIILDEPFSGLDPLVRDELVESLLDRAVGQQQDPPTILVSSHDLAEIETLATHIGFLDRGRLLFSEEAATLTSRFREVTVTLAPNTTPPTTYPVSALPRSPSSASFTLMPTPNRPSATRSPQPSPTPNPSSSNP